jgi:hypothetical protein
MKTTTILCCAVFCLFLGLPQSRADTIICSANPNNLVTNCGFETGDFTGWTLSGNDVPGEQDNLYGVEGVDPLDGISPNSGSNQAYFADLVANSTTLSQTISTVAGGSYDVSWYLAQDTAVGGGYSNAFSASFGGVTMTSLTAVPVQGYTLYSYQAVAASSSSVLSLTLGNDLGEFLLDDVSVSTPEPSGWMLTLAGVLAWLLCRRYMPRRAASRSPTAYAVG